MFEFKGYGRYQQRDGAVATVTGVHRNFGMYLGTSGTPGYDGQIPGSDAMWDCRGRNPNSSSKDLVKFIEPLVVEAKGFQFNSCERAGDSVTLSFLAPDNTQFAIAITEEEAERLNDRLVDVLDELVEIRHENCDTP